MYKFKFLNILKMKKIAMSLYQEAFKLNEEAESLLEVYKIKKYLNI